MQPKGTNKKEVLAQLRKYRSRNQDYDSGRILCSMCTKPHPLAQQAYRMFLESNLGDSGLFPGSAQLEREVVADLAGLLHCNGAVGFVVSGGTEANLTALLAAKTMAKSDSPEVVLPQSAHFSFTKICNLLNLKPRYAGLDASFRVDPVQVERSITKNTVAIVGTAGTAELGVVDPIEELSEIAQKHCVCLHVDAAFGGLVIPFLKCNQPKFDFSLEGVKSVTVDPHKMGLAAVPAGGILFRDPKMLDYLKTETPYLTNKTQYTFVGTRTGAGAASAWAAFKALGVQGYQKIVDGCMRNTFFLARSLKKAGAELVVEPTMNLVAFRTNDSKGLAEKLWSKGWFVSYVPHYDCIRVVVMPHVKRHHLVDFLEDSIAIEKL